MAKQTVRRRELLRLAGVGVGASVLTACLPGSQSPGASEAPETIGRYQLGRIEGGEVVLDSSKHPRVFKEAPELAALVRDGKLPPVAERIGQDPLVIKPLHGVGRYGSVMRKALITPEATAINFAAGPSSFLYFNYEWTAVVPNIARSFDLSADGRVVTLHLRRGMKWSDGMPFTAEDVLFWYEDMYKNRQVFPGPLASMQIGGKDVTVERVDDFTVRFVSPEPNYLMPERLASGGELGGQADLGNLGYGGYAPKHYLRRFHPKYTPQAEVDKLAADANLPNWPALLKARNDWLFNPDLPVLAPWKTRVPETSGPQFVMERNPYSIWVDTEGNQLPYVTTLQHDSANNLEVVALRAAGGEYDFQDRHLDATRLPFLLENQERGGYRIYLDPSQVGVGIALNLAYDADAEIGTWIRTTDFRRALSLGLDRDQINEAFFLGAGRLGSIAPAATNRYSPGAEWQTKWATSEPAQANALLDQIGLTQKDGDGFRLRKDGQGKLRLTFMAVNRGANWPEIAEMIKRQWARIGIDLFVDSVAAALGVQRINANQAQMIGNAVGTEDVFLAPGTLLPGGRGFSAIAGLPYAQWQATGGRQGREPFPELREAMDLLSRGYGVPEQERIALGKRINELAADNVFAIGIVSSELSGYGVRYAKKNLRNIPGRLLSAATLHLTSIALPMTFYYE